MEPWIETYTGKSFWYDRYNPENITIEDIASALSKICRFSGHCNRFYSVAEHSYYVSMLVPKHLALAGLLHDASEAYLSDIPSPVKQLLPEYKMYEEKVMEQIADKFNLPIGFAELLDVKAADWSQLKTEAEHLLPSKGANWFFPEGTKQGALPHGFPPHIAYDIFIDRYSHVT